MRGKSVHTDGVDSAIDEVQGRRLSVVIVIQGPDNIYNASLVYVVSRELRASCTLCVDLERVGTCLAERNGHEPTLLLVDGARSERYSRFRELIGIELDAPTNVTLALYNLAQGVKMPQEALRKGVRGLFFAEDKLPVFLKGLRALLNGEVWLSRDTLLEMALDDSGMTLARAAAASGLTRREVAILAHISRGETNDEISDSLGISTHTVKSHLYSVYRKINVSNRFQAGLWAAKHLT